MVSRKYACMYLRNCIVPWSQCYRYSIISAREKFGPRQPLTCLGMALDQKLWLNLDMSCKWGCQKVSFTLSCSELVCHHFSLHWLDSCIMSSAHLMTDPTACLHMPWSLVTVNMLVPIILARLQYALPVPASCGSQRNRCVYTSSSRKFQLGS